MIDEFVAVIDNEKKIRYIAFHLNEIPPIVYFENADVVFEE